MDKKLIVIFYGRFQPPHLGHLAVYQKIASVFGAGNVYIGTSNVTDSDKSPLSFQWKQKLLRGLGVPSNKIIQTHRNYSAEEVEKALGVDPRHTVFIVAVGQKDSSRLSRAKYFEQYKKGMKVETMDKKGYYFIIPNIKLGGKIMSATDVRNVLRKDKLTNKDYAYLKQAIGASRAQVDNLVPLFEHKIITEGGAGGHMSHPYEDITLTFSDMEGMISSSLSGELSREEVTEKVDGQNLFASIIGGKLRLARNKGNLANRGAQSMSIDDMAAKWKDKPDIAAAFVEGARSLEAVLTQLKKEDQIAIFNNGENWINLEVVWSANRNVIDYDRDVIILHNVNVVDENGSAIGLEPRAQKQLFSKINQFNAKNKSNVQPPIMMKINQHVDFSTKEKYFLGKLRKFRSINKAGPNSTLGDWMWTFWDKRIKAIESKLNHRIDKQVRNKLLKRLVYGDKSYTIPKIRKDIGYEPVFNNVKELLNNSETIAKEATSPLEILFLELGAEVLQNVENVLAANPTKAAASLRKDVVSKISQIRSSKNVEDLEKMRVMLRKIQALGGLDKIVPTEGIVFKYNGKTYKLTGIFAPINQLMGIGRFAR